MSVDSSRPMVLCMAVHPPTLAATRLRMVQHFPAFEAAGLRCELWTFLADGDLPGWYGRSLLGRLRAVLRGILRVPRALRLLRRARMVVIQRECLPFGPPLLELWAARRRPVVWDVDDFVWRTYVSPTAGRITRWLRASERKHQTICRRAIEVWAGSAPIVEWARQSNSEVELVPTVVNVPDDRPRRPRTQTAAWVGSHSTAPFLQEILPVVLTVEALESCRVIGGTVTTDKTSTKVVQEPWSPEAELDACETAKVGLYPIDTRNPYAEGKCGLKAVLYMAHGLPCVVTPTGPNAAIVREGVDGLYARSDDEWRTSTQLLLADDDLWERCSKNCYARARKHYSAQVWGPRLAQRLASLANQ